MGRYEQAEHIEPGYSQSGYVEGDSAGFLPDGISGVSMRFFVSDGKDNGPSPLDTVKGLISEQQVGLLLYPETGDIVLTSKTESAKFSGVTDDIKQAIADLQSRAPTILQPSIVNADGEEVAGATITQTGNNTFEVTVPDDLVATGYRLKFSAVG
ncbi:hypothetical protein [Nitratifractor salsuginis]|uniref:Uncharacterized protein n=1 Tax=Nitratifractor salsuginis (strain DSM 16511 / JCM 12458 / E9I37-1) TaxID=749222 RepID=E6WY46_NITSE|nr:hypothetical protein [Nitratifractor salsuginis]ADV46420.1 hypothetical protein Nitsa_1167 [Nitratifractor salsuginis DSM 16511]